MLKYAVAAAALLAVTPAVADPNCSTKMLEGRWTIQMTAQGNDRQKYEMICSHVRIDRSGDVAPTKCGVLEWKKFVTVRGQLKLDDNCALTGNLATSDNEGNEKLTMPINGYSDSLGNMLLANAQATPSSMFNWLQIYFRAIRQP
jgi:hypothetical protein